jgi:hypothetical protein
MCIGVLSVASKDEVVKLSRKCTEKTEDRDLNTRGVGLSERMEAGSSAGGAVTTMTRATFATCLDFVLPVGPKYDGIVRTLAGSAVHAKGVKLITLFVFGSIPKGPGRKGFEFAAGEVAKGELFGSGSMGGDGTNEMVNSVIGDVIGGDRRGSTKSMNGTEFNGSDAECIVGGSIGSGSLPKGQLMLGSMAGRGGWQRLRGKSDKECGGRSIIMTKIGKFSLSLVSSVNRNITDGSEVGTDVFAAGGPETTAKGGSSRGRENVGDVGAVGGFIGLETETKERVRTSYRKRLVVFGDKRTELKTKVLRCSEFGVINGEGRAILSAMEMLDIGGKFVGGKVVHTFVETNVESNFDTMSGQIIPKYVFNGVGKVTKKNAFLSMRL